MHSHPAILSLVFYIPFAVAQVSSYAAESDTKFSKEVGGMGGMGGHNIVIPSGIFPIKFHNSDANERSRLVVEWGKASMGHDLTRTPFSLSSLNYKYLKNWKDDDSLRPDRLLALRGRLLIESEDGKSRKPIDWLQGIRVAVSRLPEKEHDWRHLVEAHDAVWGDSITWDKGEFLVPISPGELCRTVGRESRFQVAIFLVEWKDQTITWMDKAALLPQSVAMLKIPGPPEISETMQIINGAPSCDPNNFNPAKLVRAVNHLVPLGKDKAIRELRAFLKIARDPINYKGCLHYPTCFTGTVRRDVDIDSSDRACVFLIVRLLFESAKPTEKLPDIRAFPLNPFLEEKIGKHSLLHPLYLQDDVPFFLVNRQDQIDDRDQPEQFVDWAEKHGRIRSRPLRPLDNPMIAAERLIALPQNKRLYKESIDPDFDFDFKDLIYRQAWNIIEDVNPKESKLVPPANILDKPDWEARVKAASKFKIHWSEEGQKYIMGRSGKVGGRSGSGKGKVGVRL